MLIDDRSNVGDGRAVLRAAAKVSPEAGKQPYHDGAIEFIHDKGLCFKELH